MALLFIRTLGLFLACLMLPHAMAANVALVLSENTGPYEEFSAAFQESLAKSHWKISYVGKADALLVYGRQPDLIVTVGSAALLGTLPRAGNTPVLATLIPRKTFSKLIAEQGQGRPRGATSAIFLDQPIARISDFVHLLLPTHRRIGLLTSDETRDRLPAIKQAAGKSTIDSEEVASDGQLLAAINELLPRVDLLLALPDSSIYKRYNIKPILITAFRHQRPVIAFSKALVSAGALAAIYSTPEQMAEQAAEVLKGLSSNASSLPAAQMAGSFSISINSNVAESLKLSLPGEASLYRALKAEGAPR